MAKTNKLNPQYQKLIEQIKIDGENYTNAQMKGVYAQQKSSLTAIHTLVGLMFIKYATDGLLKLTAPQKTIITAQFATSFKAIGKELGTKEVTTVTKILGNVFSETYYKNAYTMQSGISSAVNFNILKQPVIDSAVETEFKGEMFSDRIWNNKAGMIDMLKNGLTKAMQGNTSIDALGKNIQNTFNVTAYQSMRLVHTEMARVQSQASDTIGQDAGITQQMYTATLDNKTSPECSALSGTIYDINDPDKVVPPENHPNCRCVLQNMPDNWNPSTRMDNETKEMIPYQTYADWASDKGIPNDDE